MQKIIVVKGKYLGQHGIVLARYWASAIVGSSAPFGLGCYLNHVRLNNDIIYHFADSEISLV